MRFRELFICKILLIKCQYAFNDSRHIIKSHIHVVVNAPTRVEIPIRKSIPEELIGDSKPRQKRGRPVGAKDVVPQKRKLIGLVQEVANAPESTYPRSGTTSRRDSSP